MTIYCDTTFFIGLYIAIDNHSVAALAEWKRLDYPQLLFTPLHRLEVRNAVRQFEFMGDLKPAKVAEVLRCLDEDLADGTLAHQSFDWTNALRQADRTGEAHTRRTGMRAMDLFHVGVALELDAELFLTFDERPVCDGESRRVERGLTQKNKVTCRHYKPRTSKHVVR